MMNFVCQLNPMNKLKKIVEVMENAVKLEVPNKVDYEFGKNWGTIND